MASIVLRSAGSALGNFIAPGIGGTFLGALGAHAGGVLDGKLGLTAHVEGPRLENLSIQDSRYGAGIPIAYGRVRVAGNVIWSSDLIETRHDTDYSGGKGGGGSVSSTTYSYSVHCAVAIAMGEIGGIRTIWADSKVIYQDGVWSEGTMTHLTIYTGNNAQLPDSFIESFLGSGNVPAWRSVAYVVMESLQLANFGNRMPNLTFELIAKSVDDPAPKTLGTASPNVRQFASTLQNGGMRPITLDGSNTEVRRVAMGGHNVSGSFRVFEVVEYDVSDKTPVEVSRAQSGTFSPSSPYDCSWAMSPDGTQIAMLLLGTGTTTHFISLYNTNTRSFGPILTLNLSFTSSWKQIAWLDNLHCALIDQSGTTRGVRTLARAGNSLVDMGFTGVWGVGSTTSRLPLYHTQFIPFAGGLIALMTDNSVSSYMTALYACTLTWQNGALIVGTPYTVFSGVSTGLAAAPCANIVRTAMGEWTLCFSTTDNYHLVSFIPGATSATVTRSWQTVIPSIVHGSTNFPIAFGDRLVLVQRDSNETTYRLTELSLDTTSFAIVSDAVTVAGSTATSLYFAAKRLDTARFLLMNYTGSNFTITHLDTLSRGNTGSSLSAIVGDILDRAGYAVADYDISALSTTVDGYIVPSPGTARAALEPLQVLSPFDLVEEGQKLIAKPRRASADSIIDMGEARAIDGEQFSTEQSAATIITRAEELDLPREVHVDYIDAARDFEVNSARASRATGVARAVQKLSLPIVMGASSAKQIAEMRLYMLWAERELIRLNLSRRYIKLNTGDVVDCGLGANLRVTRTNQQGGIIRVDGFYASATTLDSGAIADGGSGTGIDFKLPEPTILMVMDLPLLQSTDDQPGTYVAVSGNAGWTSSTLWRAQDGINYSMIASSAVAATMGCTTTLLGTGPTDYIDRSATLNVQILNGTLSSCTEGELLNGANAALVGNEIIQFQTATLIGPGLYTLSNLLRGRRGTENYVASHALGENFALLTAGAVTFIPALLSDRGQSFQFRAVTKGQNLGDVLDTPLTYAMNSIKPFAPANITGIRANGTGSDLTIAWKRRARMNAAWVDNIDVPLDEAVELYDLTILNGGNVVRTYSNLTSPAVTYTAAEQTADWGGSIPSSFTIAVYQVSARYGRGTAATATI